MFVININGDEKKCFSLVGNKIEVYNFNDLILGDKLLLNSKLSAVNVSTDIDKIRAFYIGMATRVTNNIKIVTTIADDEFEYSLAFRSLFRNLGYVINEMLLTTFNISLFVDECMNIVSINILPLLNNNSNDNYKEDVLHYITKVSNAYSNNEIKMLNKHSDIFVSGMYHLNLR